MTLMLIALAIFGVTYLLIITEWINKMLAAMMGGFAIVLTGIVHQKIAFAAIDWNVIFFLIGMMMVISVMRQTGVFMFLAIKLAKIAKGKPLAIMILMFLLTTVISAFLGSVTTIMILVPIVLLVASELKISPIPFIITMVIASNGGGAATMIGDPPNILIGSATDYDFMDFLINLTPPVILITIFSTGLIWLLYRKGMHVSNENRAKLMSYNEKNLIKNRKLLIICGIVLVLMLIALSLQSVIMIETATIAMTAGLFLLVISDRKRVEHILSNDIDWVTIFFFMGLFMIVESLVETGFISMIATGIMDLTHGEPRSTSMVILWVSGVFSAFIDNVPFVAAMIPVIKELGTLINNTEAMHPIWWALALGTCLGGNGTLIGASANIVAIGIANRNGYHISFREYTKIGGIFALLAIVVSSAYLLMRYFW
ncbi:MAG: ArsB/NhaD family transporter [Candidatus Cloacimonetes bacterium]|nr:ArsB/NhaD family transporter [Candidatus Cloacimonadota bacterium]HOA28790.1 ArsB/NhaD family transporter [Candidatus Cloacimonadota bacterium]HPI24840.1 ArsB/NhaD family transporter [Candidatus Cloacimonadota bacterium]